MESRPSLQINMIPTEERHYAGFAFKHPMEETLAASIGLSNRGELILSTLERRESFTLVNPDIFPEGVRIDVTGVKKMLASRYKNFRMVRATVNEGWCKYILENNGVEEQRVASLTPEDLERPGIMIVWTDDMIHTTIIDGSHRLVRRFRDGNNTFEMAILMGRSIIQFLKSPETNAALSG